jgi:hypothetical protein
MVCFYGARPKPPPSESAEFDRWAITDAQSLYVSISQEGREPFHSIRDSVPRLARTLCCVCVLGSKVGTGCGFCLIAVRLRLSYRRLIVLARTYRSVVKDAFGGAYIPHSVDTYRHRHRHSQSHPVRYTLYDTPCTIHRDSQMQIRAHREGCVYTDTHPCKTHLVFIWRIPQAGGCELPQC